jgi:hypothetical protein
VFNLSAVVQSPKLAHHTWQMIAGDWQFSPILQLKSSNFFTVTSGVDTALTGQTGETPNLVSGLTPYVSDHSCSTAPCVTWITPKGFASAASGTYGNLGYNNLKGPGVFSLNVALTRTFQVRERKSIQVRGEAFNLPNHSNFNAPVATLNSGTFGQIQSSADPRILQLAMKLIF